MLKIINVVGARPNFMKIAPLIDAMNRFPDRIEHLLVHTGQHYDRKMSKAFFEDLGMPRPDLDLGVGSGTHAEQTGRVMVAFEKVCHEVAPDLVIVVGDVNSTMACTITAKKAGIQVAHVEAGLRSRDMAMPEEINRLCTDVLCDYLFTTDVLADRNLLREGVPKEKIHFVGNVMIDTLLKHREKASKLDFPESLNVTPGNYAVLTLHRPSNVDDRETLEGILEALVTVSKDLPIVFPVHPRTKKMVRQFSLEHHLENTGASGGFRIIEPVGYLDFLHLNIHARMILTDSGGIQEEATVLRVPCITLRFNTERPITCEMGTNVLVGNRKEDIVSGVRAVLAEPGRKYQVPDRWDGKAADRIVRVLLDHAER